MNYLSTNAVIAIALDKETIRDQEIEIGLLHDMLALGEAHRRDLANALHETIRELDELKYRLAELGL